MAIGAGAMMDAEKRKNVRINFNTRVVLKCEGQTILSDADTRDISLKGMFIKTDRKLAVGTSCDLELVLSGASTNLSLAIEGKIARQEAGGLAVSFDGIDLDSYWHLKNLLLYNAPDPDGLEKEFPEPFEGAATFETDD
jgi:hypothetical protein